MIRDSGNKTSLSQFLKTDGGKTKSNAIEIPSIALPKGGGAIKGIDEKFTVNPVNGTATFSIPLPFSPARGASPSLSLTYNSGSGNSAFGLGWNLGIPSIKRKTDKGLPQYLDASNSDTFLFSEAEDLVPVFKSDVSGSFILDTAGNYLIDEKDSPDGLFTIRLFKPRIEGLFARIERWSARNGSEVKWRIITRENSTTLFGWTASSRIADPENQDRIFEWLPEFVYDDKGNCSHYIYKKEDDAGMNDSLLHNLNRIRKGHITYTNTYLEKVLYGNKTPYKNFGVAYPPADDYLFSTLFDYGEYRINSPFDKIKNWDFRPDPFSDYKAGFEIRTTRLCKRVLLYHHFTGVNEYEGLVRSLNFDYDTGTEEDFTYLKAINTIGYIKKTGGTYSQKRFPPLEFEYQDYSRNKEVKTIETDDLVHAPIGLDGRQYQFIDLFNEGLAGILTEDGNGWYYKHNLGDGKFEQAKLVSPKPSFAGLGGQLQLTDLDGDGGKQLVSFEAEPRGFFELNDDNEWQGMRSFITLPNIDFGDANTRMLDLNGDGIPEVVISEEQVFTWYASEGRDGYSAAQRTLKSLDEEAGPNIVFADARQTVFLADMSGDGMTDIVRIRNGEVCYWPNMGYGKFGAKVTMDNSPVFDHPDAFNPSYIRLADMDGSGTSDIIYLGKNKFTCWKNLNGNSFGTIPFEIDPFPEIHSMSEITVADLLGNGLACIVWSSSLSKDANAPLKYINLLNSSKPHIMVKYRNNLGKEVSMEYTPSTRFFIEDKLAGKPWETKLHFPIHCVSRTLTEDKISGYRFVSEYKYHHGYYDHAEREFRGFGMVEQTDAETFEHWKRGSASNIVEEPLHQEPVVTRSWYHTGAFLGKDKILDQFAGEYWYKEMQKQGFTAAHHEVNLPDARLVAAAGINPLILDHLSGQEWREAVRACKGMGLRSEIFAKDAVKYGKTSEARKKELIPYSVNTHNCLIELVQPKGKNKHAIFLVKESEAITYNYERKPEDPRISHNLNIKLDRYGNILEAASVVYPRSKVNNALPSETQDAQAKTVILYTQNRFTNDVLSADIYRLRLPSEVRTFELKGVEKGNIYYSPEDFTDILSDPKSDTAIYPEFDKALTPGKAQKRLIEHVRSVYYHNNLTGPLPLHQLESLALPFESYQLAYSPELVSDIFGSKVNAALLKEGKFTNSEGDNNWWIRSGTTQFKTTSENQSDAQSRFYTPVSYTDPFGAITRVKYFGTCYLFVEETEDALGNKSSVDRFNFRTLSPQRLKDINGNLSEVISDELGIIKALAVMGKGIQADDISGISEFTDTAETDLIHHFFNVPKTPEGITDSVALRNIGRQLLKNATVRFVYQYEDYRFSGKPEVIAAINREMHYRRNDGSLNPDSKIQIGFEYSNGIGEVIMKKVQAEPGEAKQIIVNTDDTYTLKLPHPDTSKSNPKQLRWIGNGRTIKNNKGNAVKRYEPYFSVNCDYEDHKELVETGVTPVMYFDAAGRLIKTEMPDGTFSKVEFDSWKQIVYDANDTVLESSWYQNRINRLIDAQLLAEGKDPGREKQAAEKAAKHAGTSNVLHIDTSGRPVLSIDHNKNIMTEADEFYHTKIKLDAEGNLRTVTDARGNTVMQYKYDMLGNLAYQNSMDAGQRWLLTNISGKPFRTWDERDHEFQYEYDILGRPVQSMIINTVGNTGDCLLNNVYDRIVYGESLLSANRSNEPALQARNLLGKVIQHYDTGGLIDTPDFDFKGQATKTTRKLFRKYKETANWMNANLTADLEPGTGFTFTTETDALGRITSQTAPDKSIITPLYNEGGLLENERVNHINPASNRYHGDKEYIKNIDYNEKGQREKITYGNDVITRYYYDRETFRLKRLESKRSNGNPLQDWYYTYDPVGNITHIEDKNIPVVFFNNQKVAGISDYTYDALYRLAEATGRENNAALTFGACDNWNDRPYMHAMNPGDPMAVRNYTQRYRYDPVGNILEMEHRAAGGDWTRSYEYEITSNRLKVTQIGDNGNPASYTKYRHHTKHGFLEELPHLEEISWNFKEEVVLTTRQHCTDDHIPVITYYQYDGSGQRIRKITENQAAAGGPATKKEERIYIAGYELYKKHSGTHAGLERVSLSLMDQDHRFVMIETRNTINDGTEKQLVRYQMQNHIGSASLEIDGSAAVKVISYEEYHPYGTTAYQAINATINAAAKRYRYTGMERDEETGLEYHSARYYIPWLGRWLSADPIGIDDGVNIYQYVGNNTLKSNDIDGCAEKKSGQETTVVRPFLEKFLKQERIKFIREVSFEVYVPSYGMVGGRIDYLLRLQKVNSYLSPFLFLETKGSNLFDFTSNQEQYVPILNSLRGSQISLLDNRGRSISANKGNNLFVNQENYSILGTSNMTLFPKSYKEYTSGKSYPYSFMSKSGEMKFAETQEEFYSMLKREGINPLSMSAPRSASNSRLGANNMKGAILLGVQLFAMVAPSIAEAGVMRELEKQMKDLDSQMLEARSYNPNSWTVVIIQFQSFNPPEGISVLSGVKASFVQVPENQSVAQLIDRFKYGNKIGPNLLYTTFLPENFYVIPPSSMIPVTNNSNL